MKPRFGLFLIIGALFLSVQGCQKAPTSADLLSDDPQVRGAALEKLKTTSPKKKEPLIAPLVDALDDLETRVVYRAMEALSLIGPSSIPALKETLQSEDIFARMSAAEILGRLGPEAQSCTADLVSLLNDQHPLVRESAAVALGRIGPPAKTALTALSEALKDKNEDVRGAAEDAVKKIKGQA